MNQETKAIAAVAGVVVIMVGSAINYVRTVRAEKKKRTGIDAWEAENLACIENSHARLIRIAEGPDFNWNDFMKALGEEQQFLKIVRDQPKY